MSVNDAAAILKKQFPGRVITGYWVKDNGYVFNTRAMVPGEAAPGQYLVTTDGKIYGTNPVRSALNPSEMKKF